MTEIDGNQMRAGYGKRANTALVGDKMCWDRTQEGETRRLDSIPCFPCSIL